MSKIDFDHMVYVRVTEGCNIECDHCFIPPNPKKMSFEDIKKIPDIVRNFASPGSVIEIRWHGGEPTIAGFDFIEQSIEYLNSQKDFVFKHSIQTNLINDPDKVIYLSRKYMDSKVGISWDYGIRKVKKSFESYDSIFWENYRKIKDAGLDDNLVITVTKILVSSFKPVDFVYFLEGKGANSVHLERLVRTGKARNNWDTIGLTNMEHSKWMRGVLLAYASAKRNAPKFSVHISPFDDLIDSVKNSTSPGGCYSGVCDNRLHTIDANGYKYGCTALTAEIDNPRQKTPIIFARNKSEIEKVRQERRSLFNCFQCQHKRYCSSGCLASSLDDGSGECTGGRLLLDAIVTVARIRASAPSKSHTQ